MKCCRVRTWSEGSEQSDDDVFEVGENPAHSRTSSELTHRISRLNLLSTDTTPPGTPEPSGTGPTRFVVEVSPPRKKRQGQESTTSDAVIQSPLWSTGSKIALVAALSIAFALLYTHQQTLFSVMFGSNATRV